jgi:dephospho-CoA kinase
VLYDVFSAARQFEVDQQAHLRLAGATKRGQRVVRLLGQEETATEDQGLSRKELRAAVEQNDRRFFISYWVK